VKSWDVGYAVGMVVDNLFFKIFTSSMSDVQYSLLRDPRGEALPALPNNPGLAMGLLEAADPTFNMTTYYVVIGVVISSVPLVSSFLILGGLRGGANFIAEGMKGYAKSFSSAAFKTSSQYGVSGWRLRGLERKYASAQEYWSSEDGQPIGYRSGRTFVNTSGSFSAIKNHFATAVSMGQRSSAARAPFRGGLSKNQLLSTLNTARGTAGAARGAASALQKGAGNGLNSPRVGKNARKQGVAHSRSGLPNKQAARVDAAQQFTGNALDGYSAAASGTGDIYSDAYGDQLMLEHKWAQLDAMLSEDAIQDMQMARVYDVFELPFMDFETDGNRIEFDVYLSSRRRFADQVNVAIQFAEDLGRAGAAAAEKNRKGRQAVKGDTRTRRRQEKQAAKNQFDNRLRAQGYPKPANIKGPTIPGPKGDESFVLRPNPNRGRGGGS